LGSALMLEGRAREAREALERALQLYRDGGTTRTRGYANALATMGSVLAAEGDLAGARMHFEDAHALFLALDELPGSAIVLISQAQVEFSAGGLAAAREFASRATTINIERNIHAGAAETLADLAAYAFLDGDFDEARRSALQSIERAVLARIEAPASALLTAACFAANAGSVHAAARILGFANARARRDEGRFDAAANALRERLIGLLDLDDLHVAEDAGAALSADDVHARARRVLEALASLANPGEPGDRERD
jgi:tetratricopeptide (TPR) repeat protein